MDALTEIPDKVNFLEEFGEFDNSLYVNAKQKSDAEIAKQNLPAVVSLLEGIPDDRWENAELYSALKLLAEKTGVKNSQLLWPMRVALSGRESTPGGATELAELLGKKETLRRLAFFPFQAVTFQNKKSPRPFFGARFFVSKEYTHKNAFAKKLTQLR